MYMTIEHLEAEGTCCENVFLIQSLTSMLLAIEEVTFAYLLLVDAADFVKVQHHPRRRNQGPWEFLK